MLNQPNFPLPYPPYQPYAPVRGRNPLPVALAGCGAALVIGVLAFVLLVVAVGSTPSIRVQSQCQSSGDLNNISVTCQDTTTAVTPNP